MGVWVHGEPRAYVVVTLVFLDRKDFIDGASWMLLECWGQMPELACVDVTVWGGCGGPYRIGWSCVRRAAGKWPGVIHCCPVCRSPIMVGASWCSWSASGASVGQEVMMLGFPVALAVGGLQMASPKAA